MLLDLRGALAKLLNRVSFNAFYLPAVFHPTGLAKPRMLDVIAELMAELSSKPSLKLGLQGGSLPYNFFELACVASSVLRSPVDDE